MAKTNKYFYANTPEVEGTFTARYRIKYRQDEDLPCLKCSDEQIEKCASIPLKPRMEKLGCAAFKVYERRGDRTQKKVPRN